MGVYEKQQRRAVQLVRGYSKDHRPDLRQLVYELSMTRDGAIPVLFKAHDGNRTDDTLHWENWQMLRGLLGRSDFLYVADSKLDVSETLLNLDRSQGRFITVGPRTRNEVDQFQQKVEPSLVRWEKVLAKRSSRKQGRIDLNEVASGLYQMREGFRMYWFRSSEKARRDGKEREDKIASAMDQLRALADPARKKKPKTEKALRKKADAILARFAVQAWVKVDIALQQVEKFRQVTRGRSSANTMYHKVIQWVPRISCSRDENAIAKAEVMNGIFPAVDQHRPGCLRCAPCLQVSALARKAPRAFEIGPAGRTHLPQKEQAHRGTDVRLFPRAASVRPDRATAEKCHARTWSFPHPDPPRGSTLYDSDHRASDSCL
jgi:hypothetical protein